MLWFLCIYLTSAKTDKHICSFQYFVVFSLSSVNHCRFHSLLSDLHAFFIVLSFFLPSLLLTLPFLLYDALNLIIRTWRRKWQSPPVFLPGKSHGQRSLLGYSPWSHKRVGHDLVTKQQWQQHKDLGFKLKILKRWRLRNIVYF